MSLPIVILLFAVIVLGAGGIQNNPTELVISFYNLCNQTVWPAFTGNSFSGGFEIPQPSDGVVQAYPLPVPTGWEGTIWARQACDFSKGDAVSCATGSCTGGLSCKNTTDVEMLRAVTRIKLQPSYNSTKSGSFFINISDATDLPVEVRVTSPDPNASCFNDGTVTCSVDFNTNCPIAAQITANLSRNASPEKVACRGTNETVEWFTTYCPQIFGNTSHDNALGYGSYNTSVTGYQALEFPFCVRNGQVGFLITFCPVNTITAPPPKSLSLNQNVTSSPSPTPTPTPAASRNPSVAVIIGSSVGGVIGIVICVFIMKMYLRRRQRKLQVPSPLIKEGHQPPELIVEPFRLEDLGMEDRRRVNLTITKKNGRRTSQESLKPESPNPSKDSEKNSLAGMAEVQTVASAPESLFDQEALINSNLNPPQEPSAVQRGGYIRRLFEDREYEAELLELMAERMDPPRRGRAASPTQTDIDPPSYHGDEAP